MALISYQKITLAKTKMWASFDSKFLVLGF